MSKEKNRANKRNEERTLSSGSAASGRQRRRRRPPTTRGAARCIAPINSSMYWCRSEGVASALRDGSSLGSLTSAGRPPRRIVRTRFHSDAPLRVGDCGVPPFAPRALFALFAERFALRLAALRRRAAAPNAAVRVLPTAGTASPSFPSRSASPSALRPSATADNVAAAAEPPLGTPPPPPPPPRRLAHGTAATWNAAVDATTSPLNVRRAPSIWIPIGSPLTRTQPLSAPLRRPWLNIALVNVKSWSVPVNRQRC
jgi:hypothetical protein